MERGGDAEFWGLHYSGDIREKLERQSSQKATNDAFIAKGGATVTLSEENSDVTILSYEVDAQIGGKLAQLGGRLIDSTARKLASEFFKSFGEVVGNAEVA